MKKLLHKKLNKKGFTLAELLIVIAIIAILVAIAIPIFTSQLNKAKIARDQANIRAVKAAAITKILSTDEELTATTWKASATVSESGDISAVTTTGVTGEPSEPGKIKYPATIVVEITSADVTN